jgi:hypothetical protein
MKTFPTKWGTVGFSKSINTEQLVKHYGLLLHLSKKYNRHFYLSWAMKKGDWWYDKDPANAKFFRIGTKRHANGNIQRGIYIGRFALVYMKGLADK